MKICYIGNSNSIHVIRWVNAMVLRGHEVHLITMHKRSENSILNPLVKVHLLPIRHSIGYYLNYYWARRLIAKIRPDLINTHYASGYGTLSRLIRFTPTLLSVWGSDVYSFPYSSERNMKIIVKNLSAANQIASTSNDMKKQVERLYQPPSDIRVTPFGVDLNLFRRFGSKEDGTINIGIVKSLEKVYGINYLIVAVSILIKKLIEQDDQTTAKKIRLYITGSGSERGSLEKLAREHAVDSITYFQEAVPHVHVPQYLNRLHIYCAPSIHESFGVSIIEASACELPVVVSNVGGLPETVQDQITGILVEPENPDQIANSLLKLVRDSSLCEEYGRNGRRHVEQLYDWNKNVENMERIYYSLVRG